MEPSAGLIKQHTMAHDAVLLKEVRPEDDPAEQTQLRTYQEYGRQRNILNYSAGCSVGDVEGHRKGFL